MGFRPESVGTSFGGDSSRDWAGLLFGLVVLAGLTYLDIQLSPTVVIIGILAVAPFLTAIRGARKATVLLALLTVTVAATSGLWNDNYDSTDFWVRLPLTVAACLFACYAAWVVALNGQIATERSEIARILQDALRPPPIPSIPGWTVEARYQPAGAQNQVGGDFYDAFRLEDGWMIVIGDVTGHGARAASLTALARYTLRTAGALSGYPAAGVNQLNDALIAQEGGALCSIALITCGGEDGVVRCLLAGHPHPLRVRGGKVEEIGRPGPVLGAFDDSEWTLEPIDVDPGDQLFLYTDGVTEARGQTDLFGGERLARVLSRADRPEEAIEKVDRALDGFREADLADDAAFMAIMRNEIDPRAQQRAAPTASRLSRSVQT